MEVNHPEKQPQKFQKKKSLGQHFLTSGLVPGWMCDAAEVAAGETVLEIGPGTGVLTAELLARGARVVAVEADGRAIAVLRETFAAEIAGGNFRLHHVDARELDVAALGLIDQQFKVVANIPYYLSGHLFRTLLESKSQPSALVFLVQKEVAERIARANKESLLSLSVKAFGSPAYVKTVKRGHFVPPPKVDSAIVSVTHINRNHFSTISPKQFFTILHLGFGQKRKQLLGNLANQYDRDTLTNIFSTQELPLTVRAEDVPLDKWLRLTEDIFSTDS